MRWSADATRRLWTETETMTVLMVEHFSQRQPLSGSEMWGTKLDFVHSCGVSQRFHKPVEQKRGDFNDIGFALRHTKSLRRSPHMMTRQRDCVAERGFRLGVPCG